MKTKENKWSLQEEELLKLCLYPSELAKHPVMIATGRTAEAIRKKIAREKEKDAKPTRPQRAAKIHAMKGRPYTKEQKALLLSDQYTNKELADMPAFQDRTYLAIRTYRNKARLAKQDVEYKSPKPRIRVKPAAGYKSRPLYQFISIAEATPARAKEWKQEERMLNQKF